MLQVIYQKETNTGTDTVIKDTETSTLYLFGDLHGREMFARLNEDCMVVSGQWHWLDENKKRRVQS